MNRNPFEVLGLPQGADDNSVKEAYKNLARQYSVNGSMPDGAKMREIDEAYDAIVLSRTGAGSQSGSSNAGSAYVNTDFSDIRAKINSGNTNEAEIILDSIPIWQRTAEWYYLKGTVEYRKGWLENAARSFERASEMEPDNAEYRRACNNINSDRAGGYRTERKTDKSSGCSTCDICSGLLCADCCCECFGGDLIPCC